MSKLRGLVEKWMEKADGAEHGASECDKRGWHDSAGEWRGLAAGRKECAAELAAALDEQEATDGN